MSSLEMGAHSISACSRLGASISSSLEPANNQDGRIEFTSYPANPNAYGNNPSDIDTNLGTNIVEADQGHTDINSSSFA